MTKDQNPTKREGYYRLIAENSRDIILTHDLNGKIVYVNPEWTKLTKFSVSETIGKNIQELVSKKHLEDLQKRKQQRQKGSEKVFTYTLEIVAKDGNEIPVDIHSSPIQDANKKIQEILIVARDIRQQIKEKNRLAEIATNYKDLFNTIEDAIYLQNETGNFLNVNQGAANLFNLPRKAFIGKTFQFVAAPGKNDFEAIEEKIKLAFEGFPQEFEFWGIRNQNDIFPKEIRLYKGSYLGKDVVIAVGREITERKKTEATFQRQLHELNILQATAYASSQTIDEDTLLRQVTNIIGNTLYPDNFGFLLYDRKKKSLLPHTSYQGIDENVKFQDTPIPKGITGKVASSGKAMRTGNVEEIPEYERFTSSTHSELCVPIKISNKILGVINAESAKKDFFTENDQRLLNTIAGQVATALEKIRLFAAEKKRREFAERLQESAAILTTTLNHDKAIDLILEEVAQVISFESASVQLLRQGYMEIVGGRGNLVLEEQKNVHFPIPGDNPNTRILETKRPLILENAPEAYESFKKMPSIQSWMGVPLITHEKLIGILTFDSNELNHFTDEDARLVSSFAHHAAIAIENAKLFRDEEKRREEAETLRETALALTSSLNLDEAIEQILEQLWRVLPYDSASVQILHGDELEIFKGRGWRHPEDIEKIRFPLDGTTPNTRVIRDKEVVILNDTQTEHAPFKEPPHDHIRAWMGVPLIIRDHVIGMLTVDSKEKGYFDEDSATLVSSFAHQAAIAIENARLFRGEKARRQEAETLRQAAHTISSSLKLEEVLETVLFSIERVIPYNSSAILLFEGKDVLIKSGRGLPHNKDWIGTRFSADNAILQKIVKEKYPVILKDAQKDESFQNWAETSYVHSWMGVPLIVRGRVIGYITLDHQKVDIYNEKDAELAQTFAYQAATAIENARLYQDALETAESRAVLHRLSQEIVRDIQSPEQTYQAIHQAAEKLMPCDAFIISLREKGEQEYDHAVYLVDKGRRYGSELIAVEKSIISCVERVEGSYLNHDVLENPLPFETIKFGSKESVRSVIVSPMYVGNTLVGAISAQSYQPYIYDDESKVLLEMLASHAAAAIENTRLFAETERRAKEFSELYELTQDLVVQQDIESLLNTTLQRATQLLGVSAGDISLYDSKKESLLATNVYGLNQAHTAQILKTYIPKGQGIVGRVAKNMKAMQINDYHAWQGKMREVDNIPMTSVISVPMLYAGKLLGVLSLYEKMPKTRVFSEAEERILTLFATQVAGALHSAQQFKQITDRLNELEAINRTSIALRNAESPDEMLPILLEEASKSLQVEVAAIWLNDLVTKEIYRAISQGWVKDTQPDRQPNDVGLIGHIFQTGEGYIAHDLSGDPNIRLKDGAKFPSGWTGAWVPIHSTENIIGVIGIMDELPREFTSSDIRLLTTLSEISGNAIYRARLHKRTEKQVERLTALRNIDMAISANFNLKTTLRLIITQAINQLNVDAACILLITPPQQTLNYFVGSGFKTLDYQRRTLKKNTGMPGKAIRDKVVISSHAPHKEKDCESPTWFVKEKIVSYYCVPLLAKGETLGVLEVFHREKLNPSTEWKNFLRTLAGQAGIAINNAQLFKNLKESNDELAIAYDTTLAGWGKALELRDQETQGHTLRVTNLTLRLAREVGVTESELIHIHRGALLHDIGKMGIPDKILHKPGPLNEAEWLIMRKHPKFAYDMLSDIPYLKPTLDIPYSHHERWDGKGYPRGLKGEEIPLAARIFSIADVWDALTTDRPYRKAWTHETVIDYLQERSGTRFDPKLVEIFIKMIEEEN